MKKAFIMIVAAMILTAFSVPQHRTRSSDVIELTGYKLRYTLVDLRDFNLWVVTNEQAFYTEFEAVSEAAVRPDFDHQMVVAAKVETTNYTYGVKFKKMVQDGNTLNVYFNVKKTGDSQNGAGPVSLALIGKDKVIKKVNFLHDDMLVKTVPIVTVY